MKVAAITAGGLLLVAFVAWLWPFQFCYDSICSRCGCSRSTREWQLPHSQSCLFKHSEITATPLSSYLLSSGLVQPHSHQWLFGQGGGNGVRCALGDGNEIRSSVWSPGVTNFLEATRRYGERGDVAKFLRLTLDRDLSRTVRELASLAPRNGFASKAAYQSWFAEYTFLVDDALEAASRKQ